MLKEQLLQEASTIDVEVQLDQIFESVDLTDEVKTQFGLVFETAVKKHALALAETHINAIAVKSDELVESQVEARTTEIETKLKESCDSFFEHLAQEWLAENIVEIDKSIKSKMFDSMFEGMKELFVQHNVVLPAESVDIVAEMEEELQESKDTATGLFNQLQESKAKIENLQKEALIKEATADLTESQKEKVHDLIEGVKFDDKYSTKLSAMVEMAKTKPTEKEKPLDESTSQLNEGLNFKSEEKAVETPLDESTTVDPLMAQYAKALED